MPVDEPAKIRGTAASVLVPCLSSARPGTTGTIHYFRKASHESRQKKTRHVLLGALAASALLLAACGKKAEDVPANANPPAAAPVAASAAAPAAGAKAGEPDQKATLKLNAYTGAYNKLIGTFGLIETREDYFEKNIARRNAADSISISDGWIEGALDQFKKGRALPAAGQTALDSSADTLIAKLDKLVTQLKQLNIYYSSKTYKNDSLARGKAEDGPLRASFDASMAAMKAFNLALGAEQKKRAAETLARLKTSGDMLADHTKLALGQGEDLLNMFSDDADIKSVAKYAQGDALVLEMEKTLASQRELYAAAKAKGAKPDYGHESTASNLVSLVGAYRDMTQSRKTEELNNMVKEYNRAVESANGID